MPPNETIFVTGFPGFLARRLVRRLARDKSSFILLTQAEFLETARQAVDSIVGRNGASAENFTLAAGDITKPDLGLPPETAERVQHEATSIFHLAAIYDLAVDCNVASHVNVEGTLNVNQFAKSVRNLRRYNYISTCYVAGKREGLILESELHHDKGFRNHYEETKYLAELEVDSLKSELPITIHRPSVVCGHSETGETAKYDGVYYLIHYLRKWPGGLTLLNIGNKEVRLNMVPFDFVIDAMVALARDERAIGATVHLADPEPLTTEELFDSISQVIKGRDSLATVPAGIVYPVLMLPFAPKITGLPHSAVPYFFLEQTYDTAMARELLGPHGISCPPFADYVEHLVNFVAENPTL